MNLHEIIIFPYTIYNYSRVYTAVLFIQKNSLFVMGRITNLVPFKIIHTHYVVIYLKI